MSALLRHRYPTPFPGGYASERVRDPWPPGEERELPADVALYLADTFPDAFEVLRAPEPGEAEALREPTLPDPFTPEDLAAALRQAVSDLVGPIRQGVYDAHLAPMWVLERARPDGARKTVIDGIVARANRIHVPLDETVTGDSPPASEG